MTAPTPQTHGLATVERAPVVAPGPNGGFAVVDALLKVMAALPNIGKDDRSPEGYSYRGIEAITRHVQHLFAEYGVLPVPQAEVLFTVPSPAMKDGWQDVAMRVEWTLIGRDGSTITAVTNGIGRDKSDKGSNKAQTQAFKYLLLPVLLIADGKDDTDGQTYEDGQADSRPKWVGPTAEEVQAFHSVRRQLDEPRSAELKAWFADGQRPPIDKSSAEQVAAATAEARRLLAKIGAGAEPDTTGMPQDAGDAQPATSPGVQPGPKAAEAPAPTELDARAVGIRSQKVFDAVIERYPDRKKSWVQDHLRHAMAYVVSNGEATSSNHLDPAQLAVVWTLLNDLVAGRATLEFSADPANGCVFAWADGSTSRVMWSELTISEAQKAAAG